MFIVSASNRIQSFYIFCAISNLRKLKTCFEHFCFEQTDRNLIRYTIDMFRANRQKLNQIYDWLLVPLTLNYAWRDAWRCVTVFIAFIFWQRHFQNRKVITPPEKAKANMRRHSLLPPHDVSWTQPFSWGKWKKVGFENLSFAYFWGRAKSSFCDI